MSQKQICIDIVHADHGITEEQHHFIVGQALQKAPAEGFFILQVDIPESLGTVPNALKGPACGDAPVPESVVFYQSRGNRQWADRMVAGEYRECSFVQVIGINTVSGANMTIFTIYGGPLAPQHPDDPSNADPDSAKEFWSKHALLDGIRFMSR